MKNIGDKNKNGQKLLKKTDLAGTDNNAKVWVLKCSNCENEYGANGTDAWERKCPACQNGKAGLNYE